MLMLFLNAGLLLGFLQTATTTQTPTNGTPTVQAGTSAAIANTLTPTDPKELLDVGRKVNGLTGSDIQPWHLKATFEVFDEEGKSKDKGTFEEWWVSDKQYKLVYQSSGFSQTEYGTDHGMFWTGDTHWPTGPLKLLRRTVLQPLPMQGDIEEWGKVGIERKFGSVKLPCTALAYKGGKSVNESSPSYCFDSTKPILRYSSTSTRINEAIFDHPFLYRGHYIAGSIQLFFLGKPALSIEVGSIEPLNTSSQAIFLPPTDAVPVNPRRIELSSVETGSTVVKKVPPRYPVTAKMQRVQGKVVLTMTIGKDGRIEEVHALAGPQILQDAAKEAVQQWLYKPYSIDGEAVEVETEAYVIFSLGG